MADTLTREGIAFGSQPLSPVPQYWNGASYEKVQGANGATRGMNYNSSGTEIFTGTTPGSMKLTATSTVVISGTSTAVISGTTTVNFSGSATIEVVTSAGGTAYFSNINPGFIVGITTGTHGNAWSAGSSISAGGTSNSIDVHYNTHITYLGEATATAALTINAEYSQDNTNFYLGTTTAITAGTSVNFANTVQPGTRYIRLSTSGVSASITATIAGKGV